MTEDDTSTDPRVARRQLRQRAEIARGREDESPRYDHHNFRNGHANGRPRAREVSETSDYDEDRRRGSRHHTNGGYKYSDESHQQSEHSDEDDDDMKKEFSDSEEDDRRNSFTPVKFKPGIEKELDSIQVPGNGTVQYLKQDDTGSMDFSGNSRHNIGRSMSSFSAHDAQGDSSSSKYGSKSSGLNNPVPPPSLPLNIPAKPNTSTRPQPRPVPAPRPKPLPSARSYGSKENVSDMPEVKLNNLSQDEVSDYRGSRERLDNRYAWQKASSGENITNIADQQKHHSRSREKLNDTSSHQRLPSNDTSEGRSSPMLHGSRENLLPKRTDSDQQRPPLNELYKQTDPQFQNNLYDPAQPFSFPGSAPGVDYLPRSDHSDGNSGVEYLPRNLGTPMKSRHMIGNQPTPSSSDYESYDGGFQPPPRLADTTPGHYDYHPPTQYPPPYGSVPHSVPYSPAAESNIDYLPRNNPPQTPRSYNNMSRSRENLSHSRENLSRSRENLPSPRPYANNMSRSRENLSRSRDYLPRDIDITENSRYVEKPGQQKSIETEI